MIDAFDMIKYEGRYEVSASRCSGYTDAKLSEIIGESAA